LIPDDKTWLALVTGALSELTQEYNWEEFGTASIADTVDKFREMLEAFEDCVPSMSDLIVVAEQRASGTAGGTFTSGAWRDRALNTEVVDSANIASLSASVLTIPAGTYRYEARSHAFGVLSHRSRLYNVTASAVIGLSDNAFAPSWASAFDPFAINMGVSHLTGEFTISVQSGIKLQHYCQQTWATYGFGVQSAQAAAEQYAILILEKLP